MPHMRLGPRASSRTTAMPREIVLLEQSFFMRRVLSPGLPEAAKAGEASLLAEGGSRRSQVLVLLIHRGMANWCELKGHAGHGLLISSCKRRGCSLGHTQLAQQNFDCSKGQHSLVEEGGDRSRGGKLSILSQDDEATAA